MSVYGDFMLMVLPDSAYIYELKGEATRTQLVLVNTFHLDNEDCHAFGASLCSVPQTTDDVEPHWVLAFTTAYAIHVKLVTPSQTTPFWDYEVPHKTGAHRPRKVPTHLMVDSSGGLSWFNQPDYADKERQRRATYRATFLKTSLGANSSRRQVDELLHLNVLRFCL